MICYLTCRRTNIHRPLRAEICSDYLAPRPPARPGQPHTAGSSSTRRRRRRRGPGGVTCDRSRGSSCRHWTSLSSRAWAGRGPRRCRHTRTSFLQGRLSWRGWKISGTDWRLSEWILTEIIIDVKRVPGGVRLAGAAKYKLNLSQICTNMKIPVS